MDAEENTKQKGPKNSRGSTSKNNSTESLSKSTEEQMHNIKPYSNSPQSNKSVIQKSIEFIFGSSDLSSRSRQCRNNFDKKTENYLREVNNF